MEVEIMTGLKLTKKILRVTGKLILSPAWVSNREWAAKKELFTNANILERSMEDLQQEFGIQVSLFDSDDKVTGLIPSLDVSVTLTDNVLARTLYDTSLDLAIFKSDDIDNVHFKREYIVMFDIFALWGTDPRTAFVNAGSKSDVSVIIMPTDVKGKSGQ